MSDGSNKHNDFEKREIRDFLAKKIQDVWNSGYPNLEYAEEQLKFWKNQVEIAKRGKVIEAMIKELGWKEHDVSDHIEYNKETYFAFIGTDEECFQYLNSLKGNNE